MRQELSLELGLPEKLAQNDSKRSSFKWGTRLVFQLKLIRRWLTLNENDPGLNNKNIHAEVCTGFNKFKSYLA